MLVPDYRRGIQLFVQSHQPPAAPVPGWQWCRAGVSTAQQQAAVLLRDNGCLPLCSLMPLQGCIFCCYFWTNLLCREIPATGVSSWVLAVRAEAQRWWTAGEDSHSLAHCRSQQRAGPWPSLCRDTLSCLNFTLTLA